MKRFPEYHKIRLEEITINNKLRERKKSLYKKITVFWQKKETQKGKNTHKLSKKKKKLFNA